MIRKIGIIVDGEGDLAALNARYPGKFRILKTDGPRGHCAITNEIIARGKKQISMLQALNCRKIILMLDFETRVSSSAELTAELAAAIKRQDFGVEVKFAIPNRMIENWYLADIEYLSKKKTFLKDNLRQKKYEGMNGKNELKKLFKKNYSYSEIIHGPQLFVLIRDNVASRNSQSYLSFLEQIELL